MGGMEERKIRGSFNDKILEKEEGRIERNGDCMESGGMENF